MKVSIVIPMYNAENYIDECITSALNQTYDDIEVIVVNDGSTDNSLKVIEKFQNKIKIINKKNGGTATALNQGIKKMKGDWFKWLSADDVLNENCIEILINEVKEMANQSENMIFYSNYDYINEKSERIGERNEPNYNNLNSFDRNVFLLDHHIGNGTTSLIHKSIFTRFGMFDEKIGYREDGEFWLRCCILNNIKLHLVPKNLAKYRIHEGQLTQKNLSKNIKHTAIVRKKILDKLDDINRKKYLVSLKKLQNQNKLQMKIRRKIRNVMVKTFPSNISNKILQMYMNRKKY